MDFAENSYYSLNQKLLALIGQWSYQNPNLNIVRRTIIVIVFICSLVFQTTALLEDNFKKESVINALPIFTAVFILLLISFSMYSNQHKVDDLWLKIKKDWAMERIEEETKIKKYYAELGQLLTTYLSMFTGTILIIFIIATTFLSKFLDIVVPQNQSHSRMLPFNINFLLDIEQYFYLIMLFTHVTLIVCFTFGVANQTLFCIYFLHSSGMFAVLGYRLQHIIPLNFAKFKDKSESINEICYNSICLCIVWHRRNIEFATALNNIYSPCYTISLTASVLLLSPTLILLNNLEEIDLRTLMQMIAVLVFLFLFNYMGQILIDSSSSIADHAYFGEWYRCSARVQKLFVLIQRRCDKPCCITAYNFYIMSLDCFRMVIQAGISYYMILNKIR